MRHWASMTFFLSVAAVFLFVALRLIRHSSKGGRRILRSADWWAIAALCALATAAAGVASYWTISLPGLLPIAAAVLFARRRAREERLKVVDGDASELPPRAAFATERSSGPRAV
jgi:Zn-dependent protease with chaperone function